MRFVKVDGLHVLAKWKGFPYRADFMWELAGQVRKDLDRGGGKVL